MARKFYNCAVEHYNDKEKNTVNWMEVAKRLTRSLTEDYIKAVPYQIKKIAVKDCSQSFMNGVRKFRKTGEPFRMSFKSRKDPKQSCYIPKSALSENGIYHTISGRLRFSEKELLYNDHCDCRLVCENGRWFVVVPMSLGDVRHNSSENQGTGDVVAIDPGIRTFATYFSVNGHFGSIGYDSFRRVLRLHLKIDKLMSEIAKEENKRRKRNLKRAVLRTRWRIHDLVDELHNKTARYLADNYSVVLFPTFGTSEMVGKKGRKIKKSVVRAMQSFRFYDFGQKLERVCAENGVRCIRCDEAYTSKTNSFNGEIMENLGGRRSFVHEGVIVDRDVNGARNILLRTMRDSSAHGCDSRATISGKVAVSV